MATSISFDAVGGPASASATSISWSHTVGSGNNRILVVIASQINSGITGATVNGVAMTLYASQVGGSPQRSVFYMVSPPVGSVTIQVNSGSSTAMAGASTSYFNVYQGNGIYVPVNAGANGQGGTPSAMNVVTTIASCWLIGGATNDNAVTTSAGAGTTIRATTSGTKFSIFDSNAGVTAGSNNLNITFGGGGNSYWSAIALIPAAGDRYWVGGTGAWDAADTSHWSLTSGGASGASVPTATDNVIFDASSGGGTATISATGNCRGINFTGYTGTFAGSSTLNIGGDAIYLGGSVTLGSSMVISYTGSISLVSADIANVITSNGKTLLSAVTFNNVNGLWTLADSMNTSSVVLTTGTFSPASFILTLTGTGTVLSASSSFKFNPGTSTIRINNASATGKTFAGGGLTYGNVYFTGSGTGAFTVSGSNSFLDFKVDAPPKTVNFTAGTTQYVQTFTVNGTAGNLITLQSTTPGSTWYLKKTTTGVVSCDYLSIRDSHAS